MENEYKELKSNGGYPNRDFPILDELDFLKHLSIEERTKLLKNVIPIFEKGIRFIPIITGTNLNK